MTRILVTGATGTIGRRLVQRLSELHAEFDTLSSKPGSGLQGDFRDIRSLERAFAGVHTLFLLLPLVPDKLQLADNALTAARAARIRHIVRSSAAGADTKSPMSLARLQGMIDAKIGATGIAHTLLRPTSFMQNWVRFLAPQVKNGAVHLPHGSGAQSMVDVRDVAEAAAAVVLDPAAHTGAVYTLTGPQALTDAQMVSEIARTIGREVRYVDAPEAAAVQSMQSTGMSEIMVDWFMSLHQTIKQGRAAKITEDVQRLTGHAPRRFADFVVENTSAWR